MRLRIQRVFCILFTALFILSIHTANAEAEVRYEPSAARVAGPVVGQKLMIDQTYAQRFNKPAPAPFEFTALKVDGVKTFGVFPPEATRHAYVKISYVTPEKQLIENIRFVDMTVPMADNKKRLALVRQLLAKKGLPVALKGYENVKVFGFRNAIINGLSTVQAAARFEDAKYGVIYLWLVGILNPDGTHCIMAMSQITLKSEVKKPQDIAQKGLAARTLSTFKYLK